MFDMATVSTDGCCKVCNERCQSGNARPERSAEARSSVIRTSAVTFASRAGWWRLGTCPDVRYRLIRSVRLPDKFRSAIVNALVARAPGLAKSSLLSENPCGFEVRHYLTKAGRDAYQTWLDRLKDLRARVAIQRRVDRIASGNFGDHKPCRDGVWELRVDVGQGYRVYYARHASAVVVLLCAGDKRTQASDIDTAVTYWTDYLRRLA